ncbi:MAG: glutaredoxin family protein [Planctomycetia bacterium]|nr:glutaredoxin family protein [Planctomycetia bacterium]
MSSTRSTSKFTAGQTHFGAVLLGLGIGVLALIAWENSSGLPWNMPRFWYGQRTSCLGIALFFIAFGLYVMSYGPRELPVSIRGTLWQPTRRGRRFQTVILYTREDCHLCDEAFDLLQNYSAYLPIIREVDIDLEPSLRQQWNTWVPVVEIDGKVRFKGRVSEMLLRRLIEGSPLV